MKKSYITPFTPLKNQEKSEDKNSQRFWDHFIMLLFDKDQFEIGFVILATSGKKFI